MDADRKADRSLRKGKVQMKKNEQLFDIMGEIPEDYIEDAVNGNTIPEKRTGIKRVAGTIAACAAAFAAVAAVPVLMMYVNGKAGNGNDQLPVTSNTVAETTDISTEETETSTEESSDYNTDNNDEIHETLSLGTGPERAENYTPDRKYSVISLDNKRIDELLNSAPIPNIYDRNSDRVSVILKEILTDQDLVSKVKNDLDALSEEYINNSGMSGKDRIINYSLNTSSHIPWNYTSKSMFGENGYLEIRLLVHCENSDDDYDTIADNTIIYDLIEGKIIKDDSELFYYGEDYVSEIKSRGSNDIYPYWVKDNFKMGSGNWIPDDENPDEQMIPDWLYDLTVIGRYRDLTGIVKDEYLTEENRDEWYKEIQTVAVNDRTVKVIQEKSRFHSENEILGRNDKLNGIYKRVTEIISKDPEIYYNVNLDNVNLLSGQYDEESGLALVTFCDDEYGYYSNYPSFYYDGQNDKIIFFPDKMLPGWKNYITSYYEHDHDSIINLSKPITDKNIDPDKCVSMTCQWVNSYYVPESDAEKYGGLENSILLSDDEIENLDNAAFVFEMYDPETKKVLNAVALIPLEKISSEAYERYFDGDYAQRIREWAK